MFAKKPKPRRFWQIIADVLEDAAALALSQFFAARLESLVEFLTGKKEEKDGRDEKRQRSTQD